MSRLERALRGGTAETAQSGQLGVARSTQEHGSPVIVANHGRRRSVREAGEDRCVCIITTRAVRTELCARLQAFGPVEPTVWTLKSRRRIAGCYTIVPGTGARPSAAPDARSADTCGGASAARCRAAAARRRAAAACRRAAAACRRPAPTCARAGAAATCTRRATTRVRRPGLDRSTACAERRQRQDCCGCIQPAHHALILALALDDAPAR
jgi:hypothetical protein